MPDLAGAHENSCQFQSCQDLHILRLYVDTVRVHLVDIAVLVWRWDCLLEREAGAVHVHIATLQGKLASIDCYVLGTICVSTGPGHTLVWYQACWVVDFLKVLAACAEAESLPSLFERAIAAVGCRGLSWVEN